MLLCLSHLLSWCFRLAVKVDSYVVSQGQEGIRSGVEEMLWFHRVPRRMLWRAKHHQQTQWYCLGAHQSRHTV